MPLPGTKASEKGQAFEELHKQITQFINWLRGTHHKCSDQHQHVFGIRLLPATL